jgi:membrane protease YdiL (CAAX protease family)
LVNGLVFVFSRRALKPYGLADLIGALFLLGALVSVRRDDDDTFRYGIALGGVFPGKRGDPRSLIRALITETPTALKELLIAVGVGAVVFPVYAFFWPMFNRVPLHRSFGLDRAHVGEIATTMFAVALTEELYFRGYLQTRIADALGVHRDDLARKSLKLMAPAIVLTSALFALTHVTVELTVPRAAVLFPGLLFGVLRCWRGGIGAAVFLHAMSNLFEQWLEGL